MTKFQVDVNSVTAGYIRKLAKEAGLTASEYIVRFLPTPPTPPKPEPKLFDFKGTVMDWSAFGMYDVFLDGRKDFIGIFSTMHHERNWMHKWFLAGARVEGRAQHFNEVYKIIWMVPAGMGLANVFYGRSTREKLKELYAYAVWLFDKKTRKKNLADAWDSWKRANPVEETEGA